MNTTMRQGTHPSSGRSADRDAQGAFFGALDLGTNNCRMMIATRAGRGFRVVDSFNRTVRLGEGLQSTGRLSDNAMERTIEALRACAGRVRHWKLRTLRGVATEACRRAENGPAFLDRVREETGLRIDVISAREEAELAIESCASLLHAPDRSEARGVLFDIGGGSTEIAWVRIDQQRRRHDLIGYISVPIGVITLSELFGGRSADDGGARHYRRMVDLVSDHLREFESIHRIGREIGQGNVRLLGTSGTVTTLAGIALGLPRYSRSAVDGTTIPSQSAIGAIELLRALPAGGLAAHPFVGPERETYVLPGCAIFEAVHRRWPVADVTIADRGLRDGMLLRMARDRPPGRAPVARMPESGYRGRRSLPPDAGAAISAP
jgi:exopolyphosphatase / guanosine-5'-triphosphate,3'-diphosphate pyrophosphatase